MRMLIVDDDHHIVALLGRVCTSDGHQATVSTSPEHALQLLSEAPFDLLITDLAMPALDGVALLRAAKLVQPALFTLIMTGHAGAYPLEHVLAEGSADVMFKPFHVNEFRARVALAERRITAMGAALMPEAANASASAAPALIQTTAPTLVHAAIPTADPTALPPIAPSIALPN